MKLRTLRYFKVLAEELHFGRAAQRLAITQPPLSAAIRSLEESLGVQLFYRTSKTVQLTPVGKAFLEEVEGILERVDRATRLVQDFDAGAQGRLIVGFASSLLYRGVADVLRRSRESLAGVTLVLQEMSSSRQIEALRRGSIDAGFGQLPSTPDFLSSLALPDDEFVLCLPSGHAKADCINVNLKQFAQDPFILCSRSSSPLLHDAVVAILAGAGVYPEDMHLGRTWLAILAMVSQGLGLAVVPKSVAAIGYPGVCWVSIEGAPAPAQARLMWLAASESALLKRFVQFTADVLATDMLEGAARGEAQPFDEFTHLGLWKRPQR